MKKTVITLVVAVFTISAIAQNNDLESKREQLTAAKAQLEAAKASVAALQADITQLTPPLLWKKGGFAALNFNSLQLSNWAAGGVSSNSITALGNVYRNYKKGKIEWINNLDMSYGLIQNRYQNIRKNEDRIDLLTKGNYGITDKLSYSALLNLRTQFAPGFDFTDETIEDDDRPAISKFMAPGFLTASLGLNYNVTDYFSVYASPATGKFTIVMDDSIADANIYIPATEDENGNQFYNNNYRAEFGALISARFKKDLTNRINFSSNLNLFNNFTDVNEANRKNWDINMENMLNMKLTDYIGLSFFNTLIYDNDIAVPLFLEAADSKTPPAPKLDANGVQLTGARLQMKNLFGVGFSYKF